MSQTSQTFLSGMKAGIPIIVGYIPVGIAFAILGQQAGLTSIQIIMMSVTVFAGASQMMACGMIVQGASLFAIILTTFLLNLRHLIMSTCVINPIKKERLFLKMIASFGITDETFAVFTTENKNNQKIVFFLGLMIVAYASWIIGSAIGTVAASFLPVSLSASMGIALYAMFIALVVPGIRGNVSLCILVIFTAVINSLLNLWIPASYAMIASTLIGALIGVYFVDLEEGEDESA